MKTLKRILSVLLALVIVIELLPATVSADEQEGIAINWKTLEDLPG